MDIKDVLNAMMYPSGQDNTRRKDYDYYDTITFAAGTTSYYFFQTALGNQFLRNKRFPIAGSEVFFVEGISAFLNTTINTVANVESLCELLQKAYLEIKVNSRTACKLPCLDFVQYLTTLNGDATPEILRENYNLSLRKLPIPIIINSSSQVEIKLVCNATVATDFNTVTLKLRLHGIQLDKLDSFYWDELKKNEFQKVPVTYYDTQAITTGNETIFSLFTSQANPLLYSQVFPLSDIQTFQLQNIEVFLGQPDVAIIPSTIYQSRLQNILQIKIDDVEFYNSNLQDKLSVLASFAGNLTDSAAATTAYAQVLNMRQSYTLRVPINFPAQGKVIATLTQPASSLGITGDVTVCFRGLETRRVA